MPKQRYIFIDNVKAFAIILVIVGHCYWKGAIPGLTQLIYSFHMPLFFIISGFFIKPRCITDCLNYSSKKYLRPYACTIFVLCIMWYIHGESSNRILMSAIYGSGNNIVEWGGQILAAGPIWFLLALWWGATVYSAIKHYIKNEAYRILSVILFFSISLQSVNYFIMPLGLQLGLQSALFLMIGDYMWKYRESIVLVNPTVPFVFFLIMFWGIEILTGSIYMSSYSYGTYFWGLLGSVCSSIMVLLFFKRYTLRFITPIGAHTLDILIIHTLYQVYCFMYGNPFENLNYGSIINFAVEVFLTVTSTLIIVYALNKIKLFNIIRL